MERKDAVEGAMGYGTVELQQTTSTVNCQQSVAQPTSRTNMGITRLARLLAMAVATALVLGLGLSSQISRPMQLPTFWADQLDVDEPVDVDASTNQSCVFVYGTLKRGFRNFGVYLQPALEMRKAAFVDTAQTATNELCLVVSHDSIDDSVVPCMFQDASCANEPPIHGEVYTVDDDELQCLDSLEGIASADYYRKPIQATLTTSGQQVTCFAYFKTFDDVLLQRKRINDYTQDMDQAFAASDRAAYVPDLESMRFLYGLDRIDEIQRLMGQDVPFDEAWLQVMGYDFNGRSDQ